MASSLVAEDPGESGELTLFATLTQTQTQAFGEFGLKLYTDTWSVISVAAAAANLNVMFLLLLKLSATHILLPQQPNLNVIERKFKRQILKPDPIILVFSSNDILYNDISSYEMSIKHKILIF